MTSFLLDAFILAANAPAEAVGEKRAAQKMLELTSSDTLAKIAGEMSKEARLMDCGPGGDGKSWLDRYSGTPLFEQAVALEQQTLQAETAQQQKEQQVEDLKKQLGVNWEDRRAEEDRLRMQRQMLDLQLAQFINAQMTQPEPAPEATLGQVAAKMAMEKRANPGVDFMHRMGDAVTRMDPRTVLKIRGGLNGATGGAALGAAAGGIYGAATARPEESMLGSAARGALGGAAVGGLAGGARGTYKGHLGGKDPVLRGEVLHQQDAIRQELAALRQGGRASAPTASAAPSVAAPSHPALHADRPGPAHLGGVSGREQVHAPASPLNVPTGAPPPAAAPVGRGQTIQMSPAPELMGGAAPASVQASPRAHTLPEVPDLTPSPRVPDLLPGGSGAAVGARGKAEIGSPLLAKPGVPPIELVDLPPPTISMAQKPPSALQLRFPHLLPSQLRHHAAGARPVTGP